MTTAALVHLAVLANENGGGFNVQPGQQQAGGAAESAHTRTVSVHRTSAERVVGLTGVVLCALGPPYQGLAQDILSDLVEDACLGLCFEVHRAVKQGYFFLDDTDQESMRDFGESKATSHSFVPLFEGLYTLVYIYTHVETELCPVILGQVPNLAVTFSFVRTV